MNLKRRKHFWISVIIITLMMVGVVTYTMIGFYGLSKKNLENLGETCVKYETALIEQYIDKSFEIMRSTGGTIDYMISEKRSNQEILDFLTAESKREIEKVDSNFSGVYGYIRGEYLDGIGWEPPEGYIPTSRDWYIAAKKAGGMPTLVSPYLDTKTKTILVSVSMLLSDGESAVSLDIELNEIQSLTENINLNGMGYGFIVNNEGLVIAHFDNNEVGNVYPDNNEQQIMMDKLSGMKSGSFRTIVGGESCTVFVDTIMDDWQVVMIVSNTRLFNDVRTRIMLQALICFIVFLVIFVFCLYAYNQTLKHSRKEIESNKELDRLNDVIINALAYAIDAKDRYTSGHSQRVAKYSLEIAKRLGKDKKEQQTIYHSALLHDVGKIRVPEALINKPGKLTDEEFDQIIPHPICSYHMVKNIYKERDIALGAKYHHERFNGTGYPSGLDGVNIPEIARIIGVADAYDAMASNRSYRKALPQEVVRAEIEKGKGKQFDPEIADIMLDMIDEDREYKLREHDENIKTILVVDDDMMARKMVEHILKDEPIYKIFSVKSSKEALETLENYKVDLVLLDLYIEDKDSGFDVFEKIKKDYEIPVVFMTADKELSSIEKALELGAEDYVVKPIIPIALKETIHAILSKW